MHKTRTLVLLALIYSFPLVPSAKAMEPAISASIWHSLGLAYYRNTPGSTYTFTGYLKADDYPKLKQYQQIIPGQGPDDSRVWPNGQALYKVPNLSLGTCVLYTGFSWADAIVALYSRSGPPYGPNQSTGGCDNAGSPPTPKNPGQMSSCDNPPGANHFAGTGVIPPIASRIVNSGIPGAKCDTHCNSSGVGQPTYPCQAGMLGCASDGTGPLCTPFPG